MTFKQKDIQQSVIQQSYSHLKDIWQSDSDLKDIKYKNA